MGTNLGISRLKIKRYPHEEHCSIGWVLEAKEVDWFFKHVGDDEFIQQIEWEWVHNNRNYGDDETGYGRPVSFAQAFGAIVSSKFPANIGYFYRLLRRLQKDKDLYIYFDI